MNHPRRLGFGTSMLLHAGVLAALVWSASRATPDTATSAAPTRMPIVIAAPGDLDPPEREIPVGSQRAASQLRVGEFHFDYRRIAERRTMLFPFLTRSLPLERTTVSVRYRRGSLALPSAPAEAPVPARRLILSDDALQQLVDGAWSRRERWKPFERIASLVTAHGPDDARVAALLRAYRDQNVLQPYVDATNHDPLLWVMLGIAADHGDFFDFVAQYASRYPSSKITTELLFLLDELAQGSFDALALLLDTRGHDLWWTREANPEAYELFVAIQRHYRVQLRKQALPREELSAYYDDVRLDLLAHIVRTTPSRYGSNDALFLSGVIYWKQGRRMQALKSWRQMTPDPQDLYAAGASEVMAVLHGTAREDGRDVDTAALDRILASERSRWLAGSVRRLARFGHRVDTF
jgi:hypothetical protein